MREASREERTTDEEVVAEFSWYVPNLAVGGRFQPELAKLLGCHFGIRRVVDLRAEDIDDVELLGRCQIDHLHLPTPDTRAVSRHMLWRGVRWVNEGFAQHEKVLIHCEYGIGRSVLLACCVLISLGHTPTEAMRVAKRARAQSSPSPEQLHALLDWAADWHRQRRSACPGCTWDDLAAIAYNHDSSRSGTRK